jgi:DNA-binding CsgD family transcriptional regulator
VPHLQLVISVLLLSTGVGGITVATIFWHRVRTEILLITIVQTTLFALGLMVSIGLFYLREIVSSPLDFGRIAGYINGILVLLLYGGLYVLVQRATSIRPLLPSLGGLLVGALYLTFAFAGPSVAVLRSWMINNQQAVTLISVGVASAFLAVCGFALWKRATPDKEVVGPLLRTIGGMLLLYATLSVVLSAVLVPLRASIDPTAILNFVLFVGWNAVLIGSFVRYLTSPVDILEDGEVPEEMLERYGISPREADVIRYVSRGLSNKEIADELSVSFTTIRTHLYNIFRKTGAASRVELLRILSSR